MKLFLLGTVFALNLKINKADEEGKQKGQRLISIFVEKGDN